MKPSVTWPNALFEPVGSNITMSPSITFPVPNDIDWLFWLPSETEKNTFLMHLIDSGFGLDSEEKYDTSHFLSLRKGKENFILTTNASFFDNFLKARNLCQFLNLTSKEDRIAVHKAFIQGEFPEFFYFGYESSKYPVNGEEPVW